ncbi:MAG: hypothetical protein IPJ40_03140 [Saprospirales bacterium]|nr:hypothetical protein [Saprospirales bacterium]
MVRAQAYADVIDIVKEADQNPENSNQVWLVYLEEGRPKIDIQTTANNTGVWNREHTYPRSRGASTASQPIPWPTAKTCTGLRTPIPATRQLRCPCHPGSRLR